MPFEFVVKKDPEKLSRSAELDLNNLTLIVKNKRK